MTSSRRLKRKRGGERGKKRRSKGEKKKPINGTLTIGVRRIKRLEIDKNRSKQTTRISNNKSKAQLTTGFVQLQQLGKGGLINQQNKGLQLSPRSNSFLRAYLLLGPVVGQNQNVVVGKRGSNAITRADLQLNPLVQLSKSRKRGLAPFLPNGSFLQNKIIRRKERKDRFRNRRRRLP